MLFMLLRTGSVSKCRTDYSRVHGHTNPAKQKRSGNRAVMSGLSVHEEAKNGITGPEIIVQIIMFMFGVEPTIAHPNGYLETPLTPTPGSYTNCKSTSDVFGTAKASWSIIRRPISVRFPVPVDAQGR